MSIKNFLQIQSLFQRRLKLLTELQMVCRAQFVHTLSDQRAKSLSTSLAHEHCGGFLETSCVNCLQRKSRQFFSNGKDWCVKRELCCASKHLYSSVRWYSRGSRRVREKSRAEIDEFYGFTTEEQEEGMQEEKEVSTLMEYADSVGSSVLDRSSASQDSSALDVHKRPVSELSVPELSRLAMNLTPYVNRSETLQKLVQLGVDLSVVQQIEGMASLLVRSKFERDILPYILFLVDVGVPSDKLGRVLTVNPHILTESKEDLEERIGYLVHKNFPLQEVGKMISRAPVMMLMSPQQMDQKLGFLQQSFGLTGPEVRLVAMKYPKILPYKKDKIALTRFQVKGFLGFSDDDMKELLLKEPRIFMTENDRLVNTFDYLHNTMLIPHHQLLLWPGVLTHSLSSLKTRHMFLLSRGRAQYDPCLENYVSMKSLVSGTDQMFCEDVAKCSVREFYDFIKTL